ncbi:hypothetical protein [Palleronia rufa]|uniref:hypothetical protein n=1 Tax=Palleronia rufa TaxID=1530186 RepID=UPI00068CD7B9|nr:hypothetical protein [Palleronia rufa]
MDLRGAYRPELSALGRFGVAWGATVAWLLIAAVGLFGMTGGEADLDPVRIMVVPVMVFGPIAVIWMAAVLSRRLAALTRAVARLQDAAPAAANAGTDDLALRIERLAAGQKAILAAVARSSAPAETRAPPAPAQRPAPPRPAPPRPAAAPPAASAPAPAPAATAPAPSAPSGPELDLDDHEGRSALAAADLIAALQFPEDPDDKQGFRALRAAMRDHHGRQIVTAAQDALTLLSQDGLYMDDFAPRPAAPDAWRRFARGARDADTRAVGGVEDDGVVSLVALRLRSDAVFRDTCQHFIRFFDRLLAREEPRLSDAELLLLADTRSARAFMLLGRAMGTFD